VLFNGCVHVQVRISVRHGFCLFCYRVIVAYATPMYHDAIAQQYAKKVDSWNLF
jgi:cytochrome c551/c552